MTSHQINLGYINKLLSIPKEQWPQTNKRFNNPGVSKETEEIVEKERQRRFQIMMDVPPFYLLELIINKRLPWT